MSDNFFNEIYVLFPDPWPKKKHHKRRIINQINLISFYNKLCVGGFLYIVSDVKDYIDNILSIVSCVNNFRVHIVEQCDLADELLTTGYARKAQLNGSKIFGLKLVKYF